MPSPAKRAANRANAKKSTGPRTPEGKAASSRNGLRHGLCAEKLLIPGEDPAAFDSLLQDLQSRLHPIGHLEENLVLHIAAAHWRLDRALPMEAQIYAGLLPKHDAAEELGSAFQADCQEANAFIKFARYQASIERSIDRTLRQLKRFQEVRATGAETSQIAAPQPSPVCDFPETEITDQSQLDRTGVRPNGGSIPASARTDEVSMNIVSVFAPPPTETLNIVICGPAELQYSQITVRGQAKLDGALNLVLLDGYVPAAGQSFTILTAQKVTGRFASVKGSQINPATHLQIHYNSTEVTLTAVFEP